VFNEAMSEATRMSAPAIVAACGLTGRRRWSTSAAATATLLAALLTAHPAALGVLFDTPSGLSDAERTLTETGVRARCEITPGDFFAAVPPGCDG